MSKRQSDYLANLLNDPAPAPATAGETPPALPAAEEPAKPARPANLLERETALARIASGDVKQVTQLLLDPARVRIWPGNARHQASLTEEKLPRPDRLDPLRGRSEGARRRAAGD